MEKYKILLIICFVVTVFNSLALVFGILSSKSMDRTMKSMDRTMERMNHRGK